MVVRVAGREPVKGSEPTITFSGEKIAGTTGCNGFGGVVQIKGTRMAIRELGSTLRGCQDPIASIEKLFIDALRQASSIGIDGENLVIAGGGGEIVLVVAPLVGH